MRFIRTLSVKHHPTGDHYSLSIPVQVAEAIGLHDEDGGLVSIEIPDKSNKSDTHKKGSVVLKAYRDTRIPWREVPTPAVWTDPAADIFKPVPIPPNTLGRSRPTGSGQVIADPRAELRYLAVAMKAMKHRLFPYGYKRGPKRRCRW